MKGFVIICFLLFGMRCFVTTTFALSDTPQIPQEEISAFDTLENFQNKFHSPYEVIPKGHWIYKGIKHLADKGLLASYDGQPFNPNQEMTRFEVATIVSDIMDNYVELQTKGYITTTVQEPETIKLEKVPASQEPQSAVGSQQSAIDTKAQRHKDTEEIMNYELRITNPEPSTFSLQPSAFDNSTIDNRQSTITKHPYGPIDSGIPEQPLLKLENTKTCSEGLQTRSCKDTKAGDRGQGGDRKPQNPKSKSQSPTPNPYSLTPNLQTSDFHKDFKKSTLKTFEIPPSPPPPPPPPKPPEKPKEVKVSPKLKKLHQKITLTQREVDILEELISIFKEELKEIKKDTKKDIAEIKKDLSRDYRDIQKLKEENQRFNVSGNAVFQWKSSGDTESSTGIDVDNYINMNVYSKPRKFDDLVLRTNIKGENVSMSYKDFKTKKGTSQKLVLRELYAGRISSFFSPLTTLGLDQTGVKTVFKLDEFTIPLSIGRTSSKDYQYGTGLQFAIPGQPASFVYLTRFFAYQDVDKDSCTLGLRTSDKAVCTPPWKNSVTSLFFNYPLQRYSMNIKAEYAHSTYSRTAFNLAIDRSVTASDLTNMTNKNTKWFAVPSLTDQDEAFLLLFDYSKGPIQMFPVGYARLGRKFASRYFGLPGFDMSKFNMGGLPIAVQSLEVYILNFSYNEPSKYKYTTYYVTGGEVKPMYLDLAAMANDSLSADNQKLLIPMVNRINNRPNNMKIKLNYWTHKLETYLTNRVSFTTELSFINAISPQTCIDANENIEIKNDKGEIIDKMIGNGIADCDKTSPTFDQKDVAVKIKYKSVSQDYNLMIKPANTSKGAYSLQYRIENSNPEISLGDSNIDSIISSIVPKGKTFYFNHEIRYRLTDISNLNFWYKNRYVKPSRYEPGESQTPSTDWREIGFKMEMSY